MTPGHAVDETLAALGARPMTAAFARVPGSPNQPRAPRKAPSIFNSLRVLWYKNAHPERRDYDDRIACRMAGRYGL